MNFKTLLFFVVGSFAALLIQFVLNHFLKSSFFYIYVPLIYLFILGIHSNSFKGMWCGAFIGFLTDIYEPSTVGANLLTFTLFGLTAGFFNNRKWILNVFVKSFIFLLLSNLAFYISSLLEISLSRQDFLFFDAFRLYSSVYLPSIFINFFAIHAVMFFSERER